MLKWMKLNKQQKKCVCIEQCLNVVINKQVCFMASNECSSVFCLLWLYSYWLSNFHKYKCTQKKNKWMITRFGMRGLFWVENRYEMHWGTGIISPLKTPVRFYTSSTSFLYRMGRKCLIVLNVFMCTCVYIVYVSVSSVWLDSVVMLFCNVMWCDGKKEFLYRCVSVYRIMKSEIMFVGCFVSKSS